MAEWLRRWTANPLGSPRVGSIPILVDYIFNNLSMQAVQSNTLNGFKKHVDRHLKYRAEAYTSQRTSGSLPRRLFP